MPVSQISCVFSFARVIENHHGLDGEEYTAQYPECDEGCLLQCDCSAECYHDDSSHREYRSGQGALGVAIGHGMVDGFLFSPQPFPAG